MEVKEAIEFIERYRYARNSKTDEIIDLLKSLEAENKKLKKENEAYKEMWEWIQGVEMWNKEYEQVVKEVVKDIEVGYMSGKTIEQIGYEKAEDKGIVNGIFNKQNKRYIKKINTFEKLKKENEAYQGMWEELRKTLLSWGTPVLVAVTNNMEGLEQKYLGGGE